MPMKFLLLRGGVGVFWKAGWKCQFYFYGRGDSSDSEQFVQTVPSFPFKMSRKQSEIVCPSCFLLGGVVVLLGGPASLMGHTPSTAGTFRKNFRKTPETLSERFLEFPSRVRLGSPKPYNSRHLRLPEHFQNFLPPPYG